MSNKKRPIHRVQMTEAPVMFVVIRPLQSSSQEFFQKFLFSSC